MSMTPRCGRPSSSLHNVSLVWSCGSSIQEDDTDTWSFGSSRDDDSSFVRPDNNSFAQEETHHSHDDPYLTTRRSRKHKKRGSNKENKINNKNNIPKKDPSREFDSRSSRSTISSKECYETTRRQDTNYSPNKKPVGIISIQKQITTPCIDDYQSNGEDSMELHHVRDSLAAQGRVNYWNALVQKRVRHYGSNHTITVEAILNLAHAHVECKEFSKALAVYKSALSIYRSLHGDVHLTVAKCLHKMGLCVADTTNTTDLERARVALTEAFRMRFHLLGPHHVDTVDSLNHLALVYLQLGWHEASRDAYYEVWVVRQGIFGRYHPSVAVAAHMLGNVHVRLGQLEEAYECYNQARNIYLNMKLNEHHPDVVRLLRDLASVERVMISTNRGYRY